MVCIASTLLINCGGGSSSGTTPSTTTTTTAPSVPTGVSATAGDGQIAISWNSVSGATSYNLYMATQSGVTKSNYSTLTSGMKHADITTTSYTHTGLTNSTTYYFIVTAVNSAGESIESSEVSATPKSGGGSNTITIKGSFSGGSHAKNLRFNKFFAWIFPSAYALNPNQVSKVIAFYRYGKYVVSTISNLNFSIDIEKGSPVGLIFVGANNNYLGYLTLGNGIDSLPLTKLASGVATIDFQTLSSSDSIVNSSYNPLGSELPLTSVEQSAIAQNDDFFASIVKNPDVDSNGTLDFLEGKFFSSQVLYYINGGNFGSNLTPTISTPANITGYKLILDATDTNRPNTVNFAGPTGSGLSNSISELANVYTDWTTYFSPYVSNPAIPPTGQYTISYKTGTLIFTIPDQSSAISNII